MSIVLRIALAAAALLALAACARPPMYEARPPDLVGLDVSNGPAPAFRNAITVGSVSVGEDTGVPWRSDVSPPEIQETLVRTLQLAGLGAEVDIIERPNSRKRLGYAGHLDSRGQSVSPNAFDGLGAFRRSSQDRRRNGRIGRNETRRCD